MSPPDYNTRWTSQRGTRPVRIANCSGYKGYFELEFSSGISNPPSRPWLPHALPS